MTPEELTAVRELATANTPLSVGCVAGAEFANVHVRGVVDAYGGFDRADLLDAADVAALANAVPALLVALMEVEERASKWCAEANRLNDVRVDVIRERVALSLELGKAKRAVKEGLDLRRRLAAYVIGVEDQRDGLRDDRDRLRLALRTLRAARARCEMCGLPDPLDEAENARDCSGHFKRTVAFVAARDWADALKAADAALAASEALVPTAPTAPTAPTEERDEARRMVLTVLEELLEDRKSVMALQTLVDATSEQLVQKAALCNFWQAAHVLEVAKQACPSPYDEPRATLARELVGTVIECAQVGINTDYEVAKLAVLASRTRAHAEDCAVMRNAGEPGAQGLSCSCGLSPPPPAVHALRHARSLCNMPGVPGTWPPGHRWVDATVAADRRDVTCLVCLRVLRAEDGAAPIIIKPQTLEAKLVAAGVLEPRPTPVEQLVAEARALPPHPGRCDVCGSEAVVLRLGARALCADHGALR